MNIRASGAPDFTQNFNRYSYALNNPLVYVDEDGEIIEWIIGGLLIGAYIGASKKGGSWNPAKWEGNWWQGAIWGGAIGALTGGIAGSIWAAGGTINFGISIFGKEIPALVLTKAGAETGGLVTLGIGGTTAATSIVSYTLGHRQETPQEKIKRVYSKTKETLHAAWNSDIARTIIPDAIYLNGSGVLTFLGGGGVDIGIAVPLRGEDAGKYYFTSAIKGKLGAHLGVGLNFGVANYFGSVQDFDFDDFNQSWSIEGDYIIGASMGIASDSKKNYLFSRDVGVGPAIGLSGGVNYHYTKEIPYIKHPFFFFW